MLTILLLILCCVEALNGVSRKGSYSFSDENNCKSCDKLCKTCDLQNGKCTSCYPGYELHFDKCVMCRPGTFSSEKSGSKCRECFEGTFSFEGSTRCLLCDYTCKTCDKITGDCTSCRDGFKLKNGKCLKK